MCYGCYEELGKPKVKTEKVLAVVSLIEYIYSYSDTGGNAHVILDDWNLEDEYIMRCIDVALVENIYESSKTQLEIEKQCLEKFLSLSMDERASALAIFEGYLKI